MQALGAAGLAVVPSVILLIGILFMPESPRWLFTIGKEEKAREILSSLRERRILMMRLIR